MKAYTDIEQSKKLTEILPIESADMYYEKRCNLPKVIVGNYSLHMQCRATDKDYKKLTYPVLSPCWSLAALLDVIPVTCDDGRHCLSLINSNPNGNVDWLCCYEDCNGNLLMECYGINQVDACYEMIIKLHEQKIL